MKSRFAALLLAISSQGAFALPDVTVDDLGLIDLRADQPVVERRYNYPGLGGGNGPAPDCLLLVSGGDRFTGPENGVERLAQELQVFDGDEVLFPSGGQRDLNTLQAEIVDGHLIYHFADLSKFVTGIRVTTKSGASLKSVIDGVGFEGLLALQVVRGCRVLNVQP